MKLKCFSLVCKHNFKLQIKICFRSNEIILFLVHRYLWKQSINVLKFLYKEASEGTTFDWIWTDVPSYVQIWQDQPEVFWVI